MYSWLFQIHYKTYKLYCQIKKKIQVFALRGLLKLITAQCFAVNVESTLSQPIVFEFLKYTTVVIFTCISSSHAFNNVLLKCFSLLLFCNVYTKLWPSCQIRVSLSVEKWKLDIQESSSCLFFSSPKEDFSFWCIAHFIYVMFTQMCYRLWPCLFVSSVSVTSWPVFFSTVKFYFCCIFYLYVFVLHR